MSNPDLIFFFVFACAITFLLCKIFEFLYKRDLNYASAKFSYINTSALNKIKKTLDNYYDLKDLYFVSKLNNAKEYVVSFSSHLQEYNNNIELSKESINLFAETSEEYKSNLLEVYKLFHKESLSSLKDTESLLGKYSSIFSNIFNYKNNLNAEVRKIQSNIKIRVKQHAANLKTVEDCILEINKILAQNINSIKSIEGSINDLGNLNINDMILDVQLITGHIFDSFKNYIKNIYAVQGECFSKISIPLNELENRINEYIINLAYFLCVKNFKILKNIAPDNKVIFVKISGINDGWQIQKCLNGNHNFFIIKQKGQYELHPVSDNVSYFTRESLNEFFEINTEITDNFNVKVPAICRSNDDFIFELYKKGEIEYQQ